MRLIDADALLEKLRKTDRYFMLKFDIESAPTVIPEDFMNPYEEGYERAKKDFERPQGKWARHDEWVGGVYVGGFYHVNCTCEDGYYSKWETNFCPNCGQPMKKGEEE